MISLITTCMGRLEHLVHSLPTYLSQQTHFSLEVIVVCYGDQDAYNYCSEIGHPRLKAIFVDSDKHPQQPLSPLTPGVHHFNPARARNIGAMQASGSVLIFTDADVLLPYDHVQQSVEMLGAYPMLNSMAIAADSTSSYCGNFAIQAPIFHQLRGFDEAFGMGYGHEDSDFFRRVWKETSCRSLSWHPSLPRIAHDDWDSVKHFRIQDKTQSIPHNIKLHETRVGRVNPYGYGAMLLNESVCSFGLQETLSKRYPWPKECPKVPGNYGPRTWDETTLEHVVIPNLSPESKVVVEIGSWSGFSARRIARYCPDALVICIDSWSGLANPHDPSAHEHAIYEKFIQNLWDMRSRVIPMRCNSYDGIRELALLGVVPDLIYIDGDHIKQVYDDVEFCVTNFPTSKIVGDDFDWKDVQAAVFKTAIAHDLEVAVSAQLVNGKGVGWELERKTSYVFSGTNKD